MPLYCMTLWPLGYGKLQLRLMLTSVMLVSVVFRSLKMLRGVYRKLTSSSRITSTKVSKTWIAENDSGLKNIQDLGRTNAPMGVATWRYPIIRGHFLFPVDSIL